VSLCHVYRVLPNKVSNLRTALPYTFQLVRLSRPRKAGLIQGVSFRGGSLLSRGMDCDRRKSMTLQYLWERIAFREILKGLRLTWRHMFVKEVTLEYPHQIDALFVAV